MPKREYIGRVTASDGTKFVLAGHSGTLTYCLPLIFSTKKRAMESFKMAKKHEQFALGKKPKLRIQEITEVPLG